MPDHHVRRSGSDYAFALSSLLPFGIAWPRDYSSVLQQTVRGLANIWGFVDGRAADLLERESDPRATIEMLEDWERAYGLPDLCLNEPQGITARRNALLHRITTIGAQSRQFFIDEAKALGYDISITEYSPFQVGVSRVGYTRGYNKDTPSRYRWYLGPPEMRYFWTVDVGKIALFYFHCAAGQCGIDPLLRNGKATDLECLIRREKPAHTIALFDYSHIHIKISPPATQLTLTPIAPVKVYSRDPKNISPTPRNLILSNNVPLRGKQGKISSAQANAAFSLTAPFVRAGVPMIARNPAGIDIVSSTSAPTVAQTWSPSSLTGLQGWYKADVGVTASGVPVTTDNASVDGWQDQSGKGQHLHRSTFSPRLRLTGLNGKPVLDMNVSSGATMTAGWALGGTGPLSIFAVGIQTAVTDAAIVSYTGNGQGNDYDNNPSVTMVSRSLNVMEAYRNNTDLAVVQTASGPPGAIRPFWAGIIFDGLGNTYAYSSMLPNGGTPSNLTSTAPFAASGILTVGSGYQSNAPGRFWAAGVAEVIVTNTALTSADRANLAAYFHAKYGL